MNNSNRMLMATIAEEMRENLGDSVFKPKVDVHTTTMELKENMKDYAKEDTTLPLLIKKYDDGYFTADLIS